MDAQIEKVNVVVVDADSWDGTREVARRHDATLLDEPTSKVKGSRRAVALNEGLRFSDAHQVVFLDADTVASPLWSRNVRRWLEWRPGEVAGVSGGCMPSDTAQGRIMRLGSPNHAKQFEKPTLLTSLPGYNSAYWRTNIDMAGGFDEELGGCEDFWLNKKIRETGFKLLGVPHCSVVHRERATLQSFSRQMRGYGWSRGRLLKIKGHFTPIHALPTLLLPVSWAIPDAWWRTFFTQWSIGYLEGLLEPTD